MPSKNPTTEAEAIPLAPCPFCDAQPEVDVFGPINEVQITCKNIGECPARPHVNGLTLAAAVSKWSRRSPDSLIVKIRERITAIQREARRPGDLGLNMGTIDVMCEAILNPDFADEIDVDRTLGCIGGDVA